MGRVETLARMRNIAIEPMFPETQTTSFKKFDKLLFINDIHTCLDDILELMYQSDIQKSDITCGVDFERKDRDSVQHYDIWVSRTINGNLVRDLQNLPEFHKDPYSRDRYQSGLPVQVYSCWGGMALINAQPFYDFNVRFRSAYSIDECRSSECLYLSKDFWKYGFGKVMVVPMVKVSYFPQIIRHIRIDKVGVLSKLVNYPDLKEKERIDWIYPGPSEIQCVNDGKMSLDSRKLDRNALHLGTCRIQNRARGS